MLLMPNAPNFRISFDFAHAYTPKQNLTFSTFYSNDEVKKQNSRSAAVIEYSHNMMVVGSKVIAK